MSYDNQRDYTSLSSEIDHPTKTSAFTDHSPGYPGQNDQTPLDPLEVSGNGDLTDATGFEHLSEEDRNWGDEFRAFSIIPDPHDDRVRVGNTDQYPWSVICSLKITAANHGKFTGTGWLISPRTVITAGHNVYDHNSGGWARSIEVIPGRNGVNRPFGEAVSRDYRSVEGWVRHGKPDKDYGAIILPEDSPLGRTAGFLGFAALLDPELTELRVNNAGYPADKTVGTMWFDANSIVAATPGKIFYKIDTNKGQSGSPVWQMKDGEREAVGIHTNNTAATPGGFPISNSGIRITEPVFQNLTSWKA